jgi:hypothetical protein
MIRAYNASYIRFEDENQKRQLPLIVIEILTPKANSLKLIVCNESHLLLATTIDSISEISGYHRYIPKSEVIFPFGIGGLTKLPTDSREGMLEGIAKAAHIEYNLLAKNFGRGLLEIDNDYIFLLE